MATIPSEWQAAIQWLTSRFTSTAIYADRKFRESELDDILPTWRNRDALFEYLEHARAISPKRAGLYTVVLPDLGSPDDPATHVTNRIQLPMSYELRDILPAILGLAPAVAPEPVAIANEKTPKRVNTPRQRTKPRMKQQTVEEHWRAVLESGNRELILDYLTLAEVPLAKQIGCSRGTLRKCDWFNNRDLTLREFRRKNS